MSGMPRARVQLGLRKRPSFEKSGAGPAAGKPARPKVNKVFLLLFVHKKKRFLLFYE
jgi:hypothetical protein